MRKVLFYSLCTAFLFSSCANKTIPLKGTYPASPIIVKSDKSFKDVWDNVIDLFAQKGLSIKIIDKSSGLIISGNSLLTATTENKNGGIADPTAYIAVAKVRNSAQNRDEPISGYGLIFNSSKITTNPIYGDWNVRIKETSQGVTINVNIVNLYYETIESKVQVRHNLLDSYYKSTGVFEKIIADAIK